LAIEREEGCGDHHEDLPVTKRVRTAQDEEDEEDDTVPQIYPTSTHSLEIAARNQS
jgi:hypothetical protein